MGVSLVVLVLIVVLGLLAGFRARLGFFLLGGFAVALGIGDQVAALAFFQGLQLEVRADHLVIGHHLGEGVEVFLDVHQLVALVVDDVVRDIGRGLQADARRFAPCGRLLDGADGFQGAALHRALAAHPVAVAADRGRALQQRAAAALSGNLHQAELADLAPLHPCPVGSERVLHALFHRAVVLGLVHVDKVDHEEPCQVAHAHLARHLVGGLEVGLQRRALHIALLGGAARVHVDADQRLRRVDHEVSPALELHRRVERRLDLFLHPVFEKERHRALVLFHVLGVGRHQDLDEVLGGLVGRLSLDDHRVHVLVVEITKRALHEVALLVDQCGGRALHGGVADTVPELREVFIVALDLRLGALGAGCAHNHAHALRYFEVVHDGFQALAVGG